MDTFFAPSERADQNELLHEVDTATDNSIIDGLLKMIGGLLAVLNEHRQIVALNEALLETMGIADPGQALGLRPGEYLRCVHSDETPGGCGTSAHCSTCGAAIAIVAGLSEGTTAERTCAMTVDRDGRQCDLYFSVRAVPITIDGVTLLLLFMQDITRHQRRASAERVFFHDISNLVQGLAGAADLLHEDNLDPSVLGAIRELTARLVAEINLQRTLAGNGLEGHRPVVATTRVAGIVDSLRAQFQGHPAASGRTVDYAQSNPEMEVATDVPVLLRVVANMVINALEATEPGDTVRVQVERNDGGTEFSVWNKQAIPDDIARRVFQRNYSTKDGDGRGLGTYSMKLLGEELLAGEVSFETSPEGGTRFTFWLPDSAC